MVTEGLYNIQVLNKRSVNRYGVGVLWNALLFVYATTHGSTLSPYRQKSS